MLKYDQLFIANLVFHLDDLPVIFPYDRIYPGEYIYLIILFIS